MAQGSPKILAVDSWVLNGEGLCGPVWKEMDRSDQSNPFEHGRREDRHDGEHL